MRSVHAGFVVIVIAIQSCGNMSFDVRPADEPSEPMYSGQQVAVHPRGDPLRTVSGSILYGWDPFVIYDAQDSLFKMWYTIYRYKVLGIGYAESRDGITWNLLIDDAMPHVLTPTEGSWDRYGVETVSILKKDGIYMMWYLGYPGDIEPGKPGRHNQVGLATSPDGIHWNKLTGPVLTATQPWEEPYLQTEIIDGKPVMYENGGVQEPAVIWDEEERQFKMWYTGHTRDTVAYTYNGQKITRAVRIRQTGHATSPDGVNWMKYAGNPVFRPKRETNWEEWFAVDHPAILKDPRKGYHLFYFSWYSIGHAFSEDGITWTRNADNPLLRYKRNADSTVVMYGGPCAFIRDSTLYLYYMRSIPGSKKWGEKGMCIGLATTKI